VIGIGQRQDKSRKTTLSQYVCPFSIVTLIGETKQKHGKVEYKHYSTGHQN